MEGHKIQIRLGKTGSGKTLDQTIQEVIPRLINGEEVYSCYWLNWKGSNFHYFVADDFEAIESVRNATIVFDEVAQSFDPREWEKESSGVRRFFQLHRKRHNDIIANTQDISLVAKTIGILAHEWILIEKVEETWIDKLIERFTGKKVIVKLDKSIMSYQRLKKLAVGFEIGETEIERGEIAIENINYKEWDIVRPDLDEYKEELVHRYCPQCRQRQGRQIKAEDTEKECRRGEKGEDEWVLINKEYCPKHKEQELIIRKSGMYDTDYEPERKGKEVIWKPFIESPKGYRMIEWKGYLTEKQEIEKKEKMKKNKYEKN